MSDKYKIVRNVAIAARNDGDTIQANIMSWNGGKAVFDIRLWKKDKKTYGRGITLSQKELDKLIKAYLEWVGENGSLVPDIGKMKPFKIKRNLVIWEHICDLSARSKGFRKELTLAAQMNEPPAFDIRQWKADYSMGDGIAMSEYEMASIMKQIILYRDGAKTPELTDSFELDCEPHQKARWAFIFNAGENIDVVAKVAANGKVSAYVDRYADVRSEDILRFIPDTVLEKVISVSKEQILSKVPEKRPDPTVTQEMIDARSFGERVIACENFSGKTKAVIAAELGVSRNTIWSWEQKAFAPDAAKLDMFAELAGVNPDWLKTGVRPINSSDTFSGAPETPLTDTFGARLSSCRKAKDLTQQDLADIVGIDRNTIKFWETRLEATANPHLADLADLLDVDLNWLLNGGVGGPNVSPKAETPEVKVYAVEQTGEPEPKKESAEVQHVKMPETISDSEALDLVGRCIIALQALDKSKRLKYHALLSEIRTLLEQSVLFETAVSYSNTRMSESKESVPTINEFVMHLRALGLSDSDLDGLYMLLSRVRFDIEYSMIHSR